MEAEGTGASRGKAGGGRGRGRYTVGLRGRVDLLAVKVFRGLIFIVLFG